MFVRGGMKNDFGSETLEDEVDLGSIADIAQAGDKLHGGE
jgi:hypothetical protein